MAFESKIPADYLPGGLQHSLFLQKLIEETNWHPSFAKKAVVEYLRFLEIVAQFGVAQTPSLIVDEVWHLHLQFTKDYWEYLCPKLLKHPLHHVPTERSEEDRAHNAQRYAATLEHYGELFGEAPQQFWPNRKEKKQPFLKKPLQAAAVLLASFMLVALSDGSSFRFLPQISGPDFLFFYGTLLLVYNFFSAGALFLDRHFREAQQTSTAVFSVVLLGWIVIWVVGALRIYHGMLHDYPVSNLVTLVALGGGLAPYLFSLTAAGMNTFEVSNGRSNFFDSSCSSCSSCGSGCGGCGGD